MPRQGRSTRRADRPWRALAKKADHLRGIGSEADLTPARVRRGFGAGFGTSDPRPRLPGSKNRRPAIRHDVGRTAKRELTLEAHQQKPAAAS